MSASTSSQPNFLIIIADDLGFSDVGCFGSEISTPNLDRLAARRGSVRLTNFHTASACSPTRSMLLSGTDNHLAGLGQMAETIKREPVFFDEDGKQKPGYEGVLNRRVAALPEILGDTHHTWLSGKWHLGLTAETTPHARGFHRSWSLLPGAGSHYNYAPPAASAPDGKPALNFMPRLYVEDDRFLDPDKDLPENFYSSDVFVDQWLRFYEETRDPKHEHAGRPWCSLLTLTAPHWPLQADPEDVEPYKGKYDDGPLALRARRLDGLHRAGLLPRAHIDAARPVRFNFADRELAQWDELSSSERAISSRTMETYAAMVTRMDTAIGRVLDRLEEDGVLDNTFVLFAADNGAEGALLEAMPLSGGNIGDYIANSFDNSLDNIGRPNSFVWYGPLWAQAATAPAAQYKAWITEGGIRCPAILHFPPLLAERSPFAPHPAADGSADTSPSTYGKVSHALTTVMDILPTILDLTKVAHPHPNRFQGREILPMRGVSWVPHLRADTEEVHSADEAIGWELFGQQAIRRGKWKAVFIPKPSGPEKWQLFNLEQDPGESVDEAERQPDILSRLVEDWTIYEMTVFG
ncbi:hypothetical protein OC846_002937 [Tilletia horrida]|uniref:Sulfatase N-terminal domain-containing protein n=1 Tax=Tilletia horrida TaxID=155126 RepID=A0AAN6JRQ2_9BASI|nr:hypothetical protein OC846_002937 [Tilletia horrida]